jgi:hypothetical protein
MPQQHLTYDQVGSCLRRAGYYRVTRAQIVGGEGRPDLISGITCLALGLRETLLQNINGGAVKDPATGEWVEAPPEEQDGGCFQISRVHHPVDLKRMPGVAEGTWGPVIEGKTAFDPGYCPRYEEALRFTVMEMQEAIAYAEDSRVNEDVWLRFGIAAHNAGKGGALRGYREGDIDRYTAKGDYSEWVLAHAKLIRRWLNENPKWKVKI